MFSETHITWGARIDFLMMGAPFGRKAVRMIKITETIRIPLIIPNSTPNMRSTQPKNAILSKYLIIIPKTLIIIKTRQKIIKKLKILRYAVSAMKRDSHFTTPS
jgi:hypothetical protein